MSAVPLDPYIVDTLMPDLVGHDRQPSAFLVYLYFCRQTHADGATTVQVALLDIAEATGLSKRAVQDALTQLVKRKLVAVARESITAIPVYTVLRPWRDRHLR
jgi:DNA-binding MarR family transcriptional regulator